MAPKKRKLELPELVKNADVEKAKLALKDGAEQKRLRSSMRYLLDQQGLTQKFDSASKSFRDEWLLRYAANRIAEKGKNDVETSNKQTNSGCRMDGNRNTSERKRCKTRPSSSCRVQSRGLSGRANTGHRLKRPTNNTVGIETEEISSNKQDALAMVQDVTARVVGKTPGSATVPKADVKPEPESKAATDKDLPSKASAGKITSNIRKVMRNVLENSLKMTSASPPNKYNQASLDDVIAMLKQFAKLSVTLEKSWLQRLNDETVIFRSPSTSMPCTTLIKRKPQCCRPRQARRLNTGAKPIAQPEEI